MSEDFKPGMNETEGEPELDPFTRELLAKLETRSERMQAPDRTAAEAPDAVREALLDPAVQAGIEGFRSLMDEARQADDTGRTKYFEGVTDSGMYMAMDEVPGDKGLQFQLHMAPVAAFRDPDFVPQQSDIIPGTRERSGATWISTELGEVQRNASWDGGGIELKPQVGHPETIYVLPDHLGDVLSPEERAEQARQKIAEPEAGQPKPKKPGLRARLRGARQIMRGNR